jgi:hypothetical protein
VSRRYSQHFPIERSTLMERRLRSRHLAYGDVD